MQSYVKTLGIIAVMTIHLMTMVFCDHPIFHVYKAAEVAFRAFVPTFFFLAGYNYARTSLPSRQRQKRYVLYLATNLVLWSLVYLMFRVAVGENAFSMKALLMAFNGYAFPGQYFLVALVLLALASAGMACTVSGVIRRFAVLLLLWLLLFLIPTPGNFSSLEIRLPFIWSFDFFLGAAMGLSGRRSHVWLSVALILCLPVSFLLAGNPGQYLSPHVHILGTLFGAGVVLSPSLTAHSAIEFLGRNTLPLYLSHPLAILAIFHFLPSITTKPLSFIIVFLIVTTTIAFIWQGKRKTSIEVMVQQLTKMT